MPLTNSQYDAVMRRYDDLREQKRYEQNERTREVYRRIREMPALDDEIARRSLEAARRRIADPSADLGDYSRAIRDIADRRVRLLKGAGYPADYLEMQYDCPLCQDTGFVDGKRCACFDRIASGLFFGSPELQRAIQKENFGNFSFAWYSDTIVDESTGMTPLQAAKSAFQDARSLFEGDRVQGNLYLYGNTGVGKTFLTHCIAAEALKRSLGVLYFSAGEFFDILAGSAFGRSSGRSSEDLMDACDLLIVDDLGTELTNAFTASSLFRVLNGRIVKGRSTVISTNLALRELSDKYSERILSRISSDYRIVKLLGNDIRILKKLEECRS